MARWTVDEPTTLDFDGAVVLKASIVAGDISVLATDNGPSLTVSEISGHPLEVTHQAGMLTLTHKRAGLDGVIQWLSNTRGRISLTVCVPRDCPVRLNLVTADAVVTGLSGHVSVNSASGNVTLDDVSGRIDANTASGTIEADGLDGTVGFRSVSGDLALAGGTVQRLDAHSVGGRVTADVDLTSDSRVQVSTVSGEVTLRLHDSASTQVSMTSVSGHVDSAFAELDRFDRPARKNLTGTLGAGAGAMNLSTVSGDIALLSRDAP